MSGKLYYMVYFKSAASGILTIARWKTWNPFDIDVVLEKFFCHAIPTNRRSSTYESVLNEGPQRLGWKSEPT